MNVANNPSTGWRRAEVFLILTAIAMPISFSTWQALFNNFAHDQIGSGAWEVGLIQSLREVPGFLAFTVIFVLLFFREQTFALLSLALLGLGIAITGFYPSFWGLMLTTFLMSVGFHYFETLHQSLALQWTDKAKAPLLLGRIVSARSFAALVSFALVYVALDLGGLELKWVYLIGGGVTLAIAVFCWAAYPGYEAKVGQTKKIVLKRRYWLWYALTFMSGSRRQIFVVFSLFLMVEKFGFDPAAMSLMFVASTGITMFVAPKIGRLVARFGERRALIFEYIGLIGVFVAYAFVDTAWIAVVLYVLDHLFFAFALAIKTYFQKIADPEDIASSSGVSFTISHIAAVFIPALYGYVWVQHSASAVFLSAAAMAGVSLVLVFLVPHNPRIGNETVVGGSASQTAPAE